jgi:hypothetical protein
MTFRTALLFSPALTALVAGCPTTETCGELGEATLEMGVGEDDYAPLPSDGVITYVDGTQGGHHIFAGLRATGILPGSAANLDPASTPVVSYYLEQDGIDVAGYRELLKPFKRKPKAILEMEGEQLILFVTDPTTLIGVPLTLHADVTDACGTHLEASAAVTLQPE